MTAFLDDKSHFEGMLSAFSNDLIYWCFLMEYGVDYVFSLVSLMGMNRYLVAIKGCSLRSN